MNSLNHNQFSMLNEVEKETTINIGGSTPESYIEEKYSISENTFYTKTHGNYLIVNTSSCECVFTDELQSEVFELIVKTTEYFEMIDIIADKLSLRDKKLYLTIYVDKFIEKLLNKGIIIPYTNQRQSS